MPLMINKDALSVDNARDQHWFSQKLMDLVYSPGMTQEAIEENIRVLREFYKENNIDGLFVTYFEVVASFFRREGSLKNESNLILRIPYTKDDFIYTDAPFREIDEAKNAFESGQIEMQLAQQAERVGIKETQFRKLLNQYKDQAKSEKDGSGSTISFQLVGRKEEVRLVIGDWKADKRDGIWRERGNSKEYACRHPIAPVGRLKNIDTGEEKLVIAFEQNGAVQYITRPKTELFDSKKVIGLAAVGVAVTSHSASALSDLLNDLEQFNYDMIPTKNSVSRLGFLSDGSFSPYTDGVEFDGDAAFGTIFQSITQQGNYETWLSCAKKCRAESKIAHTLLAASFASVLICKLGTLPFFVHLWGGGSGTGKTVALMLAASVWGNPEIGTYPQTFNATQVGHEKTAAFLNNLPMCIDELQLSKDSHGRSRFDVYQLAQGVGRTRGNKAGGLERTPTWKLCILSTGESQIVGTNAGAGAVNRVIDIQCKPAEVEKVITDGATVSRTLKQHYGHAGRKFIEELTDEVIEGAEETYSKLFAQLCSGETTEKQAMAAAMILTADRLADVFVFQTGDVLSVEDITEFLKNKQDVEIGQRGYDYLCDWVTMNEVKFEDNATERFGKIDGSYTYIIRTVYNREMENAGFDGKAVLAWMDSQHLIKRSSDGKHLSVTSRIGEKAGPVRCIVVKTTSDKLSDDELAEVMENEELL